MVRLHKKYAINLIIIIIATLIFSSCKNNFTEQEKQTIKVVEAESSLNSTKMAPSDVESAKVQMEKIIPLYYNSYKISLDVNTDTNTISGVEKISYKNTTGKDLNSIYFHLYLNAFSSTSKHKPYLNEFENKIFKYGEDIGLIDIKSAHINNEDTSFEQNDTILKVNLSNTLKDGEETEITLQFNSYIPNIAHRTGRNEKALWLGNYLPILCKYDSQGWRTDPYYAVGEPFYSDISNYEVKVITPKDYEVIGTGDESINEVNGKKVTTLTAEMVRDFGLVISKNYNVKTIKTKDGININFYYYSDNIFDIEKLLSLAEKNIEYYSSKLGNYPYTELDIAETELFSDGGMEYPSFIMMDSNYLKKYSSISHEIGHQWFSNIIGNDQINEAWLDEALNSYLQEKVLYSEKDIDKRFNEEYNLLEVKLSNSPKKGLNLSLSQYDDLSSYYNTQYIRGKLMIYSLNKKMGNELFDTFLKTYYKKYAFKTVTTEDFINTAEEVYGRSLKYFFERWIISDILPKLETGGESN